MPIPEQRDLEAARGIIAGWLSERVPGASDVEVGPLAGPAFTGFSNETLLFDASLTLDGTRRTEGLVLRVKPTQHTVFMEADFESQYRVLEALGTRTSVPVPNMRWYEADDSYLGAPFFVMDKVDGRAPSDAPPYSVSGWLLEESSPDERRTLVESGVDALAAVHAVDWRELGLEFLDKPQYGRAGIRAAAPVLRGVVRRGPTPTASHRRSRQRHSTGCASTRPPRTRRSRCAWGDARINNQLFGPDHRVRAVVDWEMVTLADPMMDLGWWLFLDRHFHEGMPAPRMEGFPTREEMVARYEQTSGRAARDLEFYEVFGGLRFAVVMMRLAHLLTGFELVPPDTDMAANNAVTRVLADMLDLPSPGEGVPWD